MNYTEIISYIIKMLENGDYVAGHSIWDRTEYIDKTLPNKILNEGLIIQDASCGLLFTSLPFRPKYKECLDQMKFSLIQYTSSAVIILSIPGELLSNYDDKFFKSRTCTSLLLELTDELSTNYKDIYGNPTAMAILPPMFILGYYDIEKEIFIVNPNYGFNDDNRAINISNLKPILDAKYEKVVEECHLELSKRLK